MSVFRKLFGVFLAALLLGGALKVGGDLKAGPEIQGALKPQAVHREAAEEIVDRLDLHYSRLSFDDAGPEGPEGLRLSHDASFRVGLTSLPDGTLSGEMTTVPPTGEARAQLLADYCEAEGFRMEECVAYADSSSDLPLFEAVGFPVAVNPETRLAAIARKRGWLVENWSKAAGGPRPLLPIAPFGDERLRRSGR